MSTNHISKIEGIVETLNMVPFVTSGIMSTLAFGRAMSLVSTRITLDRLWDESDPAFANLDDERRQELSDSLQQRLSDTTDLLSWLSAFVNREYVPSGERVVDIVIANQERDAVAETPEEEIEAHAKLFDLTIEQARRDIANAPNAFRERQAAAAEIAQRDRDQLIKMIDNAVLSDAPEHLDVNAYAARTLADKIAGRLEYEDPHGREQFHGPIAKRRYQAARTMRQRTKSNLGAEVKLLTDVINQCDKLLDEAELEIESERGNTVDHAQAA